MTKIFVPNSLKVAELLNAIRDIEAAGYDKSQAFVGGDFPAFFAHLRRGDTAVAYSLTAFRSITEILAVSNQLAERGVVFRSIKELWFNEPKTDTPTLMIHLFRLAEQLHQQALPHLRLRDRGKRSSSLRIEARVALAQELRATKQLSIASACRAADCSVSAYYTHQKKR